MYDIFKMKDDKIKNFIDEMTSLDEVTAEMKKIGENYIKSEQIEAQLLADWMYRFGVKIDEISKANRQNAACCSVAEFVQTLENANEATHGSQMRFG